MHYEGAQPCAQATPEGLCTHHLQDPSPRGSHTVPLAQAVGGARTGHRPRRQVPAPRWRGPRKEGRRVPLLFPGELEPCFIEHRTVPARGWTRLSCRPSFHQTPQQLTHTPHSVSG